MEEVVAESLPKLASPAPSLPMEVLHIIFSYFDSLELPVY